MNEMEVRLQKLIAGTGLASRRKAEELITTGRVTVNGKVVTELGMKVDPERDHVKVDGKHLTSAQPFVYLMLNKPKNVMSTLDDPGGRTTVKDFLRGVSVRVFPVGRLDFDSEGLMLLTNNGDLAQALLHPRYHVPKTYLIKVKGVLSDEEIAQLERGVKLADGMTSPASVKKIRKAEANSWVEITIHEGRKHQVKRMLESVGHLVIKLVRVKMGPLALGNLEPGEFRFLTDQEANALRSVVEQRRTMEQEGKDPGARPPRPKRREGWAKPTKAKRHTPKKARRVA
jgi:23S rRNA pseudouridine2605 synthase